VHAVVCPARCACKIFAATFRQIVWNIHARETVARERAFGKTHNLPLAIPAGAENLPLARILVVDDDAAVQGTVRLLLERAGHSVVTAGDGRKGLSLCETGDFDLLFLDIFMPGMDGFETMRMVRQRHPLIPIIVISGRPISVEPDSAPDFLTMATKLGAVSSLQKPFRPAELLAAVARCLEAAGRSSLPSDGVASCR
jgi:CheY-like chemotaxis protein